MLEAVILWAATTAALSMVKAPIGVVAPMFPVKVISPPDPALSSKEFAPEDVSLTAPDRVMFVEWAEVLSTVGFPKVAALAKEMLPFAATVPPRVTAPDPV